MIWDMRHVWFSLWGLPCSTQCLDPLEIKYLKHLDQQVFCKRWLLFSLNFPSSLLPQEGVEPMFCPVGFVPTMSSLSSDFVRLFCYQLNARKDGSLFLAKKLTWGPNGILWHVEGVNLDLKFRFWILHDPQVHSQITKLMKVASLLLPSCWYWFLNNLCIYIYIYVFGYIDICLQDENVSASSSIIIHQHQITITIIQTASITITPQKTNNLETENQWKSSRMKKNIIFHTCISYKFILVLDSNGHDVYDLVPPTPESFNSWTRTDSVSFAMSRCNVLRSKMSWSWLFSAAFLLSVACYTGLTEAASISVCCLLLFILVLFDYVILVCDQQLWSIHLFNQNITWKTWMLQICCHDPLRHTWSLFRN